MLLRPLVYPLLELYLEDLLVELKSIFNPENYKFKLENYDYGDEEIDIDFAVVDVKSSENVFWGTLTYAPNNFNLKFFADYKPKGSVLVGFEGIFS